MQKEVTTTNHKSTNYLWFHTLIKSYQISLKITHKSCVVCKWSDGHFNVMHRIDICEHKCVHRRPDQDWLGRKW